MSCNRRAGLRAQLGVSRRAARRLRLRGGPLQLARAGASAAPTARLLLRPGPKLRRRLLPRALTLSLRVVARAAGSPPVVLSRRLRLRRWAPRSSRYCRAISQENVDKARAFIEAYNRRDFDAAVEWFDPDIDWVLPERQAFDSCRGVEQVIRFFEGLDETMDDLQLVPQEFRDGGDRVATRLRHRGRGKGSGAEIDTELYHQVATFRDGVIVRMEYFGSWPEALEAAGVSGDPPPGT